MRKTLILVFIAAITLAIVSGEPSGWGGYFQYANVPGWGQYEFGYNRGNHDHFTSRFEQGWGWKFKTKVRWGDKKGGYGEMYYDYQHSPKKGWGHGHHHHGKHHLGSYSENIPTILKPTPNTLSPLASNPQAIGIPPPQGLINPPPPPQRLTARTLQIDRLISMPQQQQQQMYRNFNNQPVYYHPYQMRY